jgi:hypothetical protein
MPCTFHRIFPAVSRQCQEQLSSAQCPLDACEAQPAVEVLMTPLLGLRGSIRGSSWLVVQVLLTTRLEVDWSTLTLK